MTKNFDFLMRPKRKERLDSGGNQSRGLPDERGFVPRGWCAGQMLIGRWCAVWRHVLAAGPRGWGITKTTPKTIEAPQPWNGYATTKVSRAERSTLIELTVGPASTVDLEGSRWMRIIS